MWRRFDQSAVFYVCLDNLGLGEVQMNRHVSMLDQTRSGRWYIKRINIWLMICTGGIKRRGQRTRFRWRSTQGLKKSPVATEHPYSSEAEQSCLLTAGMNGQRKMGKNSLGISIVKIASRCFWLHLQILVRGPKTKPPPDLQSWPQMQSVACLISTIEDQWYFLQKMLYCGLMKI